MRLFLVLGLLVTACVADIKITDSDRTVDISTQVVKVSYSLTVQNTGNGAENAVTILLSDDEQQHLSHISATSEKKNLGVKKEAKSPLGYTAYAVAVKIAGGATQTINIEYYLTQLLTPFPTKITQEDTQLVVYNGNAYVSSPYPIANQKTTVVFGTGKMQSFTAVSPSKQIAEKVVYGTYTEQPALAKKDIRLHYENVAPFLVATRVERAIEISHWGGNIAVEEFIEIVHKGANLTGPFSRLDFQMDRRQNKQPCVKQYKTVLPAAARDIYYRDEIGNISTSTVKIRSDSVEVEIRPRYPLFGGWKTSYVIGYNVPSYEYLYVKDTHFVLKMRLFDHIYDNAVVEKLTTKIILPESSSNIQLKAPYEVTRRPNEVHATYLDTSGRPVVVVEKESLVDAHIKEFSLSYDWSSPLLPPILHEPLLASLFYFVLFSIVIIYVRFDFSITKDVNSELMGRLFPRVDALRAVVGERQKMYDLLSDAVTKLKETRNQDAVNTARSKISNERSELSKRAAAILEEVKAISTSAFDKAQELEKIDKWVSDGEKAYVDAAAKSSSKNSVEDRQWVTRVSEAKTKADKVLSSLYE